MTERIQQARKSVQRAVDVAKPNVREQLLHVDEGLMELESGDKTPPETMSGPDALEEIESKLAGMIDRVDDADAERRLRDARDELDLHRQARGIDTNTYTDADTDTDTEERRGKPNQGEKNSRERD